MIITVTMNPAIDKTVEIEQLVPNGLNRIQKVEYDAGGKGINVSKTIHELGGESLAMGFLGGNAGKTIENVLTSWNIQHDFIWVEGETRTNTKVFEKSGGVTELNEPGPVINEAQVEELYGDSRDDEWKQEEIARLKAEQGIAEVAEPGVNMAAGLFNVNLGGGEYAGKGDEPGVQNEPGGVPGAAESGE